MINRREKAKFWRVPDIEGVELLRATYITQNFSRHMHDCYAFGVVEGGVQAFYYRHANHIATKGDIVTCLPDEVHTGHAVTENGWTYRMFYPDVALLQYAAAAFTGILPISAILLSAIILGEPVTLPHLLGFGCVVVGIVFIARDT